GIARAAHSPDAETSVVTRRPLVLVIEDDEDVRAGMAAVLEAGGYESVTVESANRALPFLRQATVKPSVILLDLVMPGMSGGQFRAEQMHDPALATIPVIFVSGCRHTLHDLQRGALRAAAMLEKPVDSSRLLALVRQLAA